MIVETLLLALLSLLAPTPCRARDPTHRLFAGYQKGLRLLAQAGSTFARE